MAIKILIGSVLKPVDDVRHYHKIAKTLVKQNTEIHIFGFHSNVISDDEKIIFHTQKPFKRISFKRLLAPIKFLFLGLKLQPNLIICTTHELLKVASQIKLLTGAKLFYDIQENYFSNIIHANTTSNLIKYPIGLLVRLNEYIQSIFVNHFILAEKCYLNELPFVNQKNSTILENKFQNQKVEIRNQKLEKDKLIITGTLGKHYGTLEGIHFFKELNKIKPETTLEITGICRDEELHKKLQTSNFKLQTSNTSPIPYTEIIKTIEQGGIALLPYQPNKSTKNRIPTKFYEYLYYKIPMIVQKNKDWEEVLKPYKAAIFIDFNNFNIEEVITQLETYDFYTGKEVGEEILWKSEELKLISLIKS